MFQWRKFQFFDREPLTDDPSAAAQGQEKKGAAAAPATEKPADSTAAALFQSFESVCSSSGRGRLVFGDKKGVIRIVDRDFKALTFQAFDNDVIALQQLKRSNTLVSVGLDAGITLKIWRWDQFDTDGKPMLARALKLFPPGFDAKVSCFAVVEDISQLALGLGNGGVLLLDGNILRDRQPRQRWLVKEGPVVTGLHMAEENNAVTLFVTTIAAVHSISLKAKAPVLRLLDEEGGADLTCSVVNEDRRLVVGREKAVYFYEAEEKGVCFGFEGLKKAIGWFNSYLYVVEEDRKEFARNTLTIYDLKNKFIAFSAKFDTIVDTVAEWQSLFVVTANRQVWQLQEKDLPTKMNMLFKKNLYSIAISLAHSQNCDDVYVKDIFQKYGDHLYSKGDYDGAIVQYIDTIPFLEPSFVIRKFLDAQRIENLTKYLQALHEKGHADANHTTLLLNCYTKQKDLDKLAQFIQDPNVSFDVSTAIAVCRQAGNYHNKQAEYYNLALFLAHRKHQHDLYLQIQIDDLRNYADALRYIWTLDYALAARFVREYGAKLVSELPAEATELLKALCTSFSPRKRDELVLGPGFVPVPSSAPAAGPSALSASASQSLLGSSPPAQPAARMPTSAPAESKDSAAKCKPEDFIHFFVGNSKHLRDFLEHIIDNEARVSGVVYNTVLELYMRQLEEEQNSEADLRAAQDKVMALLKSQNAKYDMDHALVLTKTYKFERGVTFLYEKLRLFTEIVQYHMDRGQGDKVLQACENHGDKNPQLWVQALSFFAAHPDPCDKEIVQVLRKIYEKKLLPPLMVVQVLARNPEKPLSVVKDFIIKALQEENAIIVADENELRGYQEETQQMRAEIEELRTSAAIFQGTKCHACTSGLELPAVHFLCRHSYHQRCLNDNDRECLKCAEEIRKVSEMRKHMRASANQHDLFYKQLDDASDGFAVVSDYFGRGLFQFDENDPALRDPEPQQHDGDHEHDGDDLDHL